MAAVASPRSRASLAALAAGAAVVALGVRIWLALRVPAPWIMVDELIYRDLAVGLGHGSAAVRGQGIGLVSLYPALLAPLWRLTPVAAAYDLSRLVNVVCMSGVPAIVFVWGRRLVRPRRAAAAAALALLLPAWVYAGELMTENLALPCMLLALAAIAAALPRPTRRRQAGVIALIALASLVRLQSLVLVPIWATAILTWPLLAPAAADGRRQLRRYLRRYLPTLVAAGLAAGAGAAVAAVRGGGVSGLLGFYGGIADMRVSAGAALAWVGYHVAELSLAVGFLPVAALLVLTVDGLRRRLAGPAAALVAVTLSAAGWLVVLAGVWASRNQDGIRERYLVYAVPLLLLVLVVWLDRPRASRRTTLAAAAVAGLLPLSLPLGRLLVPKTLSDAPSLVGLRWLADHASSATAETALAAAALATPVVAVSVRRYGGAVAAAFVATVLAANAAAAATLTVQEADRVSRGTQARAWVDSAVGDDADVAVLHTGNVAPMQLWQSEFWNRSVDRVYTLSAGEPGNLPTVPAKVGPGGRLRADGGRPLAAQAVVTDTSVGLDSPVLARTPTGLVLYAYAPATTVQRTFTGLYPDGWTRPTLVYRRPGCRGTARLIFAFTSDPRAPGPQQAIARQDGRIVGRGSVRPGGTLYLHAPLDAGRGTCTLRIGITPWRPARTGAADTRTLGLHYENVVALP